MNMLRTIIWVVLTAVLVIFAMANWSAVTVTVWPSRVLDTKLPLLILISFLIGSVPMWIALRTTRWTLNRRLSESERQLAELRAMAHRQSEANAAVAAAVATSPTPTSIGMPVATQAATKVTEDTIAVPARGDNVAPPPMEKL